jgi:hypothetical protein
VQWKEFGKSIWCGSNFTDNTIGKEIQADFYRKFFDMLLQSHTNGIYAWWWAGGYRIGENSDFGIINPDGSDRAVTRVMREYAPKFLDAPLLHPVEQTVSADRSENATGLEHYYRSIEQEFNAGWDANKRVGFSNAGTNQTTKTISKSLSPLADGAPDSFFMEILPSAQGKMQISVYNPSQCTWDTNVSLQLLDKKRRCIAKAKLHHPVSITETAVFEVSASEFARAAYLTLAADKDPFGEIRKI